MSFGQYLSQNRQELTLLTVQHVEIVLISVGLATVVAFVLALGTERLPRVRRATLAVTGTLLTIPSFALFGLMIPVFGLGLVPAVLALTTYAVFPILRNAVTGLEEVDPNVVDAARGIGMGTTRRLLVVRLPIAWPVILNGIRVATIMVVATAAIAAAVRGPGLGTLIFRGLARIGGAGAVNEVLAGVVGVVVVAVVLDVLFVLLTRLTTPRGLHA